MTVDERLGLEPAETLESPVQPPPPLGPAPNVVRVGRRRLRRGRRRRWVLFAAIGATLALFLRSGLAVVHGFALLDEARGVKAQLQAFATRAAAAGLDFDRATYESLNVELQAITARVGRLESELDG